MVTKPGLAIPPGEPAINPVPRQMIRLAIEDAARRYGASLDDLIVEISIPGGEALAKKTLNPRLGILGGLSILGTTGIVVPFSCAAWIHSIHRGIDVARASGLEHIAGATGAASEAAIQRMHALPDAALIEMGDFVGGMLKYLKQHPVPRVTIAGGFAKMTKLGQGLLDLHSKRGRVDNEWLAGLLRERRRRRSELCAKAREANTAQHVLELAREADAKVAGAIGRSRRRGGVDGRRARSRRVRHRARCRRLRPRGRIGRARPKRNPLIPACPGSAADRTHRTRRSRENPLRQEPAPPG